MSPRGIKKNEQMRAVAKTKITKAALEVFAEYGFHGATMKQIMQISGLQDSDVKSLEETLERLKTANPSIAYQIIAPKAKETDVEKELRLLNEKVDSMMKTFKLIFDGHCLINGRWIKVRVK